MRFTIEVPGNYWIPSDSDVKPDHGELCLIMYRTGDRTLGIGVFIDRPDKRYSHSQGYFIGVSDAWYEKEVGCEDIQESFIYWPIVDKWKPIGLAKEDEERLLETTKEIYGYDGEAPWEGKR